MPPELSLDAAVDAFVDEQRQRCLWYLRADWYPATDTERAHVLSQIQRHGDREAFARAGALKRWLSRRSKSASVAS